MVSISKTRDELVATAKVLFAKLGFNNTTMNDIATASKKGRRTIYTYFNNKNEIYFAVIEEEITLLIEALDKVSKLELEPEEKLRCYVNTRLDAVRCAVKRNGSLKADFFRDVFQVERVRKKFEKKEMSIIQSILNEGVEKGVFRIENVQTVAVTLHYALRGIDIPYINDSFTTLGIDHKKTEEQMLHILFEGIKINKSKINI